MTAERRAGSAVKQVANQAQSQHQATRFLRYSQEEHNQCPVTTLAGVDTQNSFWLKGFISLRGTSGERQGQGSVFSLHPACTAGNDRTSDPA